MLLSALALLVAIVALAVATLKRANNPDNVDLGSLSDIIGKISAQVFDRVVQMIPTTRDIAAQVEASAAILDRIRDERDMADFRRRTIMAGSSRASMASIGAAEIGTLRDLCFYARSMMRLSDDLSLRLAQLSISLGQGVEWHDADRGLILGILAAVPGHGPYWRSLIDSYAGSIGVTVREYTGNGPAPTPIEPVPADPAPLPIPGTPANFTPDEIITIRDLNFEARRDYGLALKDPALNSKFLVMSFAILDRRPWSDPEASRMLGMMAATNAGAWGPNRALIDRYAAEVNVTVANVPGPSGDLPVPVPPPVQPLPTEPPIPINTDYGAWDTDVGPVKSFASGPEFAREVLDIIQNNNLALMGRVGINGKPIMNAEGRVTLWHGGIIQISNSNFQNDDEQNLPAGVVPKHANYLDICNSDGGGRWMQYGFWGINGLIRNTMNRVFTIRAMFDSRGDACWSGDEAVTRGQMYYERADPSRREIKLSTFPVGWRLSLRASSVYGAEDIDVIQEAVDKALAARGL